MSTLYIIGNGFDLSHGLKTSYTDFSKWVEKNHSEIFDKINTMINENNEVRSTADDKIGWFDFESSLHELIQSPVFEDHVEESKDYLIGYGHEDWSDSAHHDFQNVVYDYVVSLKKLQQLFKEWIRKEIQTTIEHKIPKYQFSSDVLFFTFNYTNVLEILYQQPKENIYHIHGSYDDIIVGHSENFDNFIGDPYDEDADVRESEAARIVGDLHDSLNKNVPLQIKKFESTVFFEKLADVSEVQVIGHSYNRYDLPYFRLLNNAFSSNTRWVLNYRTDNDLTNLKIMVRQLKISNYEQHQI
ncbi:hypothetical protein LK32_06575 [Enterococcus hirae]|uniref:bacteriophage abortive infection AbiH family protein n=1 Tax=Enterococcus hirae TaxID=1354 RepID=UPI000554025F|nr:bacteriophage abortive infection AbiH family protein [Enterococcus hirae]OWW63037.1 hypothetical protein C655_13720 [Enterococcus hirae 57-09-G6]EMF0045458.1 bacteriophage abortive infection AbiH family protein [Enterococcus hirae]KNB96960.1 hypothetical protein LK32_06575 [Enterococcus hirae]MCI5921088.1 bacteriophage abortive infection AbiH family protein [Enterococcus hirae]OWW57420.1 hypothetical protein F523_13705 [Enterococcus hirae 78-09-C1]